MWSRLDACTRACRSLMDCFIHSFNLVGDSDFGGLAFRKTHALLFTILLSKPLNTNHTLLLRHWLDSTQFQYKYS